MIRAYPPVGHAGATADEAGPDRGSASLWLLAARAGIFVAAGDGAAVGAARVARQRAQVAADLGALAGAARAVEGAERPAPARPNSPPATAGRSPAARWTGLTLLITVEVAATGLPGWTRGARASARAGPIQG